MTDATALFSEWEGRRLDEIFALCREQLEDPTYPIVKKWRAAGGKVLGHFQVYFPEEIAHACGMLPVKIRGGQADGVEASQHFGSYLCSILKTSLDLALCKHIELDLFVTHPICDGARNLAGIWGRNFPYKSQVLHLPQNPNSASAYAFLRDEYRRLAGDIEAAGGARLTDANLKASLEIYNRSRRLMRELYRIRRDRPWTLGADESMVLMAMAGILPREEFNRMLETVLAMIGSRAAREQDKIRVVFEGGFCEVPPYDLLQAISRSCFVVDDDVFIGLRWILEDVSTEGDPLANLAAAYMDKSSYSPVQHDNSKPREKMLLKRVREAKAEAVILAAAKMCEPGLDEQVAYSKALDHEGIPYFVSEFEENQTTFDDISIQMETFLENVMFA
ncbi:MAG: 2-hydroxyacyl-CoA dehydratase [Betaproteobacteria bacterium]|nr:2-hydroxyacyl-CoA dehydratase [Betaproteobacteria bacterium]